MYGGDSFGRQFSGHAKTEQSRQKHLFLFCFRRTKVTKSGSEVAIVLCVLFVRAQLLESVVSEFAPNACQGKLDDARRAAGVKLDVGNSSRLAAAPFRVVHHQSMQMSHAPRRTATSSCEEPLD